MIAAEFQRRARGIVLDYLYALALHLRGDWRAPTAEAIAEERLRKLAAALSAPPAPEEGAEARALARRLRALAPRAAAWSQDAWSFLAAAAQRLDSAADWREPPPAPAEEEVAEALLLYAEDETTARLAARILLEERYCDACQGWTDRHDNYCQRCGREMDEPGVSRG